MRFLAIMMVSVLSLLSCAAQAPTNLSKDVRSYATRDGQRIALHPSGVSFMIPKEWLIWFDQHHNNFHLTHEELSKVKDANGEWDTEYAKVVNSALPFEDCVAHVGGEGWGKDGLSYIDVQMRAYTTKLSLKQVMANIHGPGFSTAHNVASHRFPSDNKFMKIEDSVDGRWMKSLIQYPVFYGDYGGLARIRFYLTQSNKQTLVLVFMGGEEDEIQEIFKSIKF
jgi:hypothetical protein